MSCTQELTCRWSTSTWTPARKVICTEIVTKELLHRSSANFQRIKLYVNPCKIRLLQFYFSLAAATARNPERSKKLQRPAMSCGRAAHSWCCMLWKCVPISVQRNILCNIFCARLPWRVVEVLNGQFCNTTSWNKRSWDFVFVAFHDMLHMLWKCVSICVQRNILCNILRTPSKCSGDNRVNMCKN